MIEGCGSEDDDANENYPASPLHSLASVAVAAAAASSNSPLCVNSINSGNITHRMPALHNKTIITNVWVPPRLDQIEVKLDRHAATPDSNGPAVGKEVGKLLLDGGIFDNGEQSWYLVKT